jgi:hypothetical protein
MQSKGREKRFKGINDVEYRQIHKLLLTSDESMGPYIERYKVVELAFHEQMDNIGEGTIEPKFPSMEDWIREAIETDIGNDIFVNERVKDLARGFHMAFKRYSAMYHDGRHFRRELIDKARRTCDSGIARKVNEDDVLVDQIGVLEDIIKIKFPHIGEIVLFKGKWYKNNARWNDCLFHSIKNSEICRNDTLGDQPFVYPSNVEQVFFAEDFLDSEWTFVLQDKPKSFIIFESIEPMVWDDGRELRGLEAGPLPEEGIPGIHCFNTSVPDITENEDDTFQEYDSGSDDEELRLRGVEEVERYLDETVDDFEDEDSDYESRRTRSLSEFL